MLTLVSRDGRPLLTDRFEAPCYGLATHPDGSLFAATFDGRVRRYAARDRAAWQATGRSDRTVMPTAELTATPTKWASRTRWAGRWGSVRLWG